MAECKQCGGKGEIDCIQCYGSGRHGNYPNPETCAHCGGSGKTCRRVAAVVRNKIGSDP